MALLNERGAVRVVITRVPSPFGVDGDDREVMFKAKTRFNAALEKHGCAPRRVCPPPRVGPLCDRTIRGVTPRAPVCFDPR